MAENKKDDLQIAAAGITGALIGAGVAVVAAVALRDEKTREKTQKALYSFRDYFWDYIKKTADKNVSKDSGVKKLKAKIE